MTDELSHDTWLLRFRWVLPLALIPPAILAAFQAGLAGMRLDRSLESSWEAFCLLIALAGVLVRVLAAGFEDGATGGRGEGRLPMTGMYSVVRYPLYLGTYISLLGLSLLPGVLWFVLVTNILFLFWYGWLVQQTEAALERQFGDAYRTWAKRIPMVIPNIFLWQPPAGRFSLLRVLRRERNDIYFVVLGFVALEFACDLFGERQPFSRWLSEDLHWAILLILGTLSYLALQLLGPAEPTARPVGGRSAEPGRQAQPDTDPAGPVTRGLRVDGRVRLVDTLENMISGGNLENILHATLDAAELRPGERLVDVGCGSGVLAVLAAERMAKSGQGAGEIVGIDATPGMIDLARERAMATGSTARFEVGTAEALPFADGALDALTSSYFFHHLPSDLKRQVLYEMWRVLKPGGRLVVADYSRPRGLAGYIASFPMRFDFHEYVRGQLSGELEALLRNAQFGKVEVLRVFIGYITVYRIVKPNAGGEQAKPA
jgi:ubiquinone/menaquinone biosynthesis C-methylase UbiE/protein-S-isoprenylcysteine O-methyltransferase Ste14